MSLTSRRERLPSNRSNISRNISVNSSRSSRSIENLPHQTNDRIDSAHSTNFNDKTLDYSNETYRPKTSCLNDTNITKFNDESVQDIIRRLKSKSTESLNWSTSTMSTHARPRNNQIYPLRTVLMDEDANIFQLSKTRTDLLRKLRTSLIPHPSYDINGDGFVSQEDYKISKRFDIDADGILNEEEKLLAKKQLAIEFFSNKQKDELALINPQYALNTARTNANNLLASTNFEKDLDRLNKKDMLLKFKGSANINSVLHSDNDALTKYNFYTNKFDVTAWNDYDAIPRSESRYGLNDHGGSRKRLLFTRRETTRQLCQSNILKSEEKKPVMYTRRINLITDPKIENS